MTCKNKSCGCAQKSLPKEEILSPAALAGAGETAAALFQQLLRVAQDGITAFQKFDFPTKESRALGQAIAWLHEERKRLQMLFASVEAIDALNIETSPTDVKIGFGPAKKYTLIVPVTGPIAKKELAIGLRDVASALDPVPQQLPLPLEY